jgi:hypothetical protein
MICDCSVEKHLVIELVRRPSPLTAFCPLIAHEVKEEKTASDVNVVRAKTTGRLVDSRPGYESGPETRSNATTPLQ